MDVRSRGPWALDRSRRRPSSPLWAVRRLARVHRRSDADSPAHQPDHAHDLPHLRLHASRPDARRWATSSIAGRLRGAGRGPARPARDPARAGALRHDPRSERLRAGPDAAHGAGRDPLPHYWYRSGVNRTMTENLHEIAHDRRAAGRPASPATWCVDIGCNDGTLLDGYETRRPALPGLRPLRRDALRDREGLRRRARLLSFELLRRRAIPTGARRSSPASRCSTTWRTRARSSPTSPRRWPRTASG